MGYIKPAALMDQLVEEVTSDDTFFTAGFIQDVIEIAAPVARICAGRKLIETVPFGLDDKAEVIIALSRFEVFERVRQAFRIGRPRLEVCRMSQDLVRTRFGDLSAMGDNKVSLGIFGFLNMNSTICIVHHLGHNIVVVQFR